MRSLRQQKCFKHRMFLQYCEHRSQYGFTTFLKSLILIFKTISLNFSVKSEESSITVRYVLSSTVAILMHVYFLYRGFILAFRVKYAGYTIKLAALLSFREVLVLVIWHSLHLHRRKIAKLLDDFMEFADLLRQFQNMKRLYLGFYAIICFIYLLPLIIATMITGIMTNEDARQYEYIALFGTVTKGRTYVIDFFLYCLYNFYLLPLPFLTSTTYIFLCIVTSRIIGHCTVNMKGIRNNGKRAENLLEVAMQICFLVEKLEESLTVSIFFVVTQNLTVCFTSFAYVLGYYDMSHPATAGVVVWFICNVVSFMAIVWTASNVNNQCKHLKRTLLMSTSRFKMDKKDKLLSTFLKLSQFDTVPLTGWQMFEFSKSVILEAAGTILTYGLLILQTRISSSDSRTD